MSHIVIEVLMYIISCAEYFFYYIAWFIINKIQTRLIRNQPGYNNSCCLKRIIWKRKFFLIDITSPCDFISINQFSTNPEYVLKPNVSLYCINKEFAYFVECDISVNIYNLSTNPFLYISQFKNAVNVVTMPLTSFYELADKVGDPRVKLCYMANTGRCGSTLLAQALEKVPGTLLLSEPDCLTNIGIQLKENIETQSEYEKMLIAAIRLLCQTTNDVMRICIKTRSCGTCHITTIKRNFPECFMLFGYRNSLKTVSSFLGLMISETVQSIAMYLIDSDTFSAYIPLFRRRLFYYFCRVIECGPPREAAENMNSVQQFTYAWANCVQFVKDFKQDGGEIMSILYEDMVSKKVDMLKCVFKGMDIDECFIKNALKAFEQDSQAESPLSRQSITNVKRRTISKRVMLKANKILAKYDLPKLGEEFKL